MRRKWLRSWPRRCLTIARESRTLRRLVWGVQPRSTLSEFNCRKSHVANLCPGCGRRCTHIDGRFVCSREQGEDESRLPGCGAVTAGVCAGVYAALVVDRVRVAAGGCGGCVQAWLCRAVDGRRRMGRASVDLLHRAKGAAVCAVHYSGP